MKQSVGYLRTSSQSNVGKDKDSDKRQKQEIAKFCKSSGYKLVRYFYDKGVSGAEDISSREKFSKLVIFCKQMGIKYILVENASRFARDLMVQEYGYDLLLKQGLKLIACDNPSSFLSNNPTAKLVRQMLGSVSEFEKSMVVSKLKGARERVKQTKKQKTITGKGKCEGRKTYKELNPEMVKKAKWYFTHRIKGTKEWRKYSDVGNILLKKFGWGRIDNDGKTMPFHSQTIKNMVDRSGVIRSGRMNNLMQTKTFIKEYYNGK